MKKTIYIAMAIAATGVFVVMVSSLAYYGGWYDKCMADTQYLVGSGSHQCSCMYSSRDTVTDTKSNDINTGNCLDYSTVK